MELGHTSKRESIIYNMTFKYANLQKSGVREVIVSSVQIELRGSVSRLLEIGYLLGDWEIVYACQPDERAISIAQFGTLLTNF
jgi:hypothetical protein